MSNSNSIQMVHQREMLKADYEMKERKLKMENSEAQLTYDNQKEAAAWIQNAFFSLQVLIVTLISQMGAGKTGTFLQTAFNMCTIPHDDELIIRYNKVFIITGMSDKDWQNDMEVNMLQSFKDRVFHRGRFPQLRKLLENGIRDALIIIDECHIGAEKEHSMSKLLSDTGLLNIQTLRDNNIKILEVSATPGHTLNDSLKWGPENHKTIILKPGPRYIGCQKMREQNRLFVPVNLEAMVEVDKLCRLIETRWGNDDSRWHLIRISRKGKKVRENLATAARTRGWDCLNHDSNNRIDKIDEKMEGPPNRHTFILIKDFWRAAKRVEYNYIGIVNEPKKEYIDTNVEAQSLVGRLCDYYPSNYNIAKAPLIFTDIDAVNEYICWIEAGGDYSAITKYRSRQLNVNNGIISAVSAFSAPSNVVGLEGVAQEEQVEREQRLANRMRGVRVPIILNVTAEEIATIPTRRDTQAKKDVILALLARSYPTEARELADFDCNEIMAPTKKEGQTYINHVGVAVRKKANNEACAVTIPEEKRQRGKVWNCFIDKFEHRLCFIIVGEV
jgi:hypothetical protein